MLLVAAALALLPAAPAVAVESVRPAAPLPDDDRVEREECPAEVPERYAERVTCGVLIVPERREADADPERTLRLPFAIVAARGERAAPDPLVFPTSGGPGAGSLSALWYFLDHADWATETRDVILLEQRGDQLAEPTLNCPELDTEHLIEDGALVSGAAARTRMHAGRLACHERLLADGVDLTAYTSAASAADLAELRSAFGYDQWNLYGVSYGARLALTTMRDHPAGLRSVILDGAYPPNVNRYEQTPAGFSGAIDALVSSCTADAVCRDHYPGLRATIAAMFERAEREPLTVSVKNPADRSPVQLTITDAELAGGLFDALYDPSIIRALPYLIDRLASGDADAALPLAQRSLDFRDWYTEGLELSIECAEEAPFNDDELIAVARATQPFAERLAYDDGLREECALWAVPGLGPIENELVVSDIPTLLTTGGFDPITPTPWSEAAAAGLANHVLVEFPTMGHGAVWSSWYDECAASVAEQFLVDPAVAQSLDDAEQSLDDPPAELDTSCIADAAPIVFLTGDDIHPTSAIYRFDSDVIRDRDPVQLAIGLSTLTILVATLIYGLVYGIRRLSRRPATAPAGGVPAAVFAAGFNLAYAGGLAWVVLTADPLILGFGLPAGIWPMLLLPFMALAAAIVLVAVLVRGWMLRDGTPFHLVFLSISAIGSLAFAAWLLARGLLLL